MCTPRHAATDRFDSARVSRCAEFCVGNDGFGSPSCNRRWMPHWRCVMRGVPVILLGDFNAPSHLDWTEAAVGVLANVTQPVPWPTSVAMEAAGLVDAYRSVYPDPVTHPGLTWPAARPFVEGYNPAADGQSADRIDFMHVSPDITVTGIQIVGEQESPFSEISVTPWPTDHRGLLASLHLTPAPPPPVVSVSRRLVVVGEEVTVRAIVDGLSAVRVVPRGGSAEAMLVELIRVTDDVWQLGQL